MEKYLTYPPRGMLPLPGASTIFDPGCDVWDEIVNAAVILNPGFDYYHIFDMVGAPLCSLFMGTSHIFTVADNVRCDLPVSPYVVFPCCWVEQSISRIPAYPPNTTAYFNRGDVKAAIHAPADVDWTLCTDNPVFPHGDASLRSAFTVLPNVIEKNKRTVIGHGLADFLFIAEGMRIVLQKCVFTLSVSMDQLNNFFVRH